MAAEEVDLDLEVVRELREEGLQQQLPAACPQSPHAAGTRRIAPPPPPSAAASTARRASAPSLLPAVSSVHSRSPPSAPPAFAAAAAASAAALASSSAAAGLPTICGSEPLQKATPKPPSAFDSFETSWKPLAPASVSSAAPRRGSERGAELRLHPRRRRRASSPTRSPRRRICVGQTGSRALLQRGHVRRLRRDVPLERRRRVHDDAAALERVERAEELVVPRVRRLRGTRGRRRRAPPSRAGPPPSARTRRAAAGTWRARLGDRHVRLLARPLRHPCALAADRPHRRVEDLVVVVADHEEDVDGGGAGNCRRSRRSRWRGIAGAGHRCRLWRELRARALHSGALHSATTADEVQIRRTRRRLLLS